MAELIENCKRIMKLAENYTARFHVIYYLLLFLCEITNILFSLESIATKDAIRYTQPMFLCAPPLI